MTDAAIIANSSPLIAIAIIEQLELLATLYQSVIRTISNMGTAIALRNLSDRIAAKPFGYR
jgi:predicted nucleic acid-binding protein